MALAALALSSCSFIDDFDFEVADGAVPTDDGAVGDAGERPDGSERVDGGDPASCVDPCLSDATLDFGDVQGSGPLQWRYLNDTRSATGLTYGELALSTHYMAPAWTDATPPPAIVDCRDSIDGACATASGQLVLEADALAGGSDPVLGFTATEDASYIVVVDVLAVDGGPAAITISRTSRLDSIAVGELSAPGTVTGVVDLLEGERGLVTVAPVADPGGALSVGASVRVSRVIGESLADCELVMPFDTDDSLALGCSEGTLTEGMGFDDTTTASGPSTAHGGARAWGYRGKALQAVGESPDYSGDFTIQLWLLVDNLSLSEPAVYTDATASSAENASGVRLSLARESDDGLRSNVATAVYRFGMGGDLPPTDPSVFCDLDGICIGTIEGSIPALDEWHFYRIVRLADSDEVRFCIDGELVGTGFLDGDLDISPRVTPTVGSSGTSAMNSLEGAIDDVRIFSRALPCGD